MSGINTAVSLLADDSGTEVSRALPSKDFLAASQDVRSPISTGEFINLPAGKPSNDRPDVADVSLRRLRTALRNGWISAGIYSAVETRYPMEASTTLLC